MAKLDPYLRSIERFQATGALMTSGGAIVMRFPTGDRSATQVTPHDQLVIMIHEVAPPDAWALMDAGRPARFEYESGGFDYVVAVTPRHNAWQVSVDSAVPGAVQSPPPQSPSAPSGAGVTGRNIRVATATPARGAPTSGVEADGGEMAIERGQYDGASSAGGVPATSGSAVLDAITRAARGARATDVYLSTGAPPQQRVGGVLAPTGTRLDGETLSRELGIIAPASARGAWTEGVGSAVFAYGDGLGRVRVTLGRDVRGPCAALRLLPDEAPGLDRLNLGVVGEWLRGHGLVLVAGPTGAGKTVVLGAIVRALGELGRRVVVIEQPIELVHTAPSVSQREVGVHVESVEAGIDGGVAECTDAIAVGSLASPEAVRAVVDAVAGGHLVIASIVARRAATALDRVLAQLPGDARDAARAVLGHSLLGIVRPVVGRDGRRYEVVPGGSSSPEE